MQSGVDLSVMIDNLIAMNDVYSAGKSANAIQVLAEFWLDVFAEVNAEVFEAAVKLTIAHESYFPTPAVVRRYVEAVQRRRDLERRTLPQVEQKVADREWVRALLRKKGLKAADGSWHPRKFVIGDR